MLGFEIDAITNSIKNVISGDSFQTEICQCFVANNGREKATARQDNKPYTIPQEAFVLASVGKKCIFS